MSPPGRTTRIIALTTPPTFALLTLLHPQQDPWALDGAEELWLAVHLGQLVLTVLIAYSIWTMTQSLTGRSASVLRAALPVFLVSFSAFDAVAGLATGWLALHARDSAGAEAQASLAAVETLFSDNWLAGNLSVMGGVTAISWATVAVAGALALRRAGADRWTVAAMAGSVLFASHPPPIGTLGLISLSIAFLRWDKRTRAGASTLATSSPRSSGSAMLHEGASR